MSPIQQQQYQKEVEEGFQKKEEGNTVEEKWVRIREVVKEKMKEAAEKIERPQRKEWLSSETMELVEKKRKAFLEVQQAYSLGDPAEEVRRKEKYKEIKGEAKKSVRRDKKRWFEETAGKMEAAAKVGNSRSLFEEVKRLTGQKRAEITKIQDKGQVQTKQKEIADIFRLLRQAPESKQLNQGRLGEEDQGAEARRRHLRRTGEDSNSRGSEEGHQEAQTEESSRRRWHHCRSIDMGRREAVGRGDEADPGHLGEGGSARRMGRRIVGANLQSRQQSGCGQLQRDCAAEYHRQSFHEDLE